MSDDDDEFMERADRLDRSRSQRSQRSQKSESAQTGGSQTSNTGDGAASVDGTQGESGKSGTSESQTSVKDLNHVAMYLDDEHDEKLNIVFEELQGVFRREHGRKLEKNRDFYPAMVRSLYNDSSIREELGLGEVNQQD